MKMLKRTSLIIIVLFILIEVISAPLEWFWPASLGGTTYWSADTDDNLVALTFDDGPSRYTEQILDILQRYNARATFFVMGRQVEAHPQLVERIVNEGHEIGNHTYDFTAQANKFFSGIDPADIAETQKLIETYTQKPVKFFRSPGGQMGRGFYNAVRENSLYVVYGALPFPHPDYDAQKQLRIARENIAPGAIIILHDGDDADPESERPQATVEMLPQLLDTIIQRGYRSTVLSEVLNDDKH